MMRKTKYRDSDVTFHEVSSGSNHESQSKLKDITSKITSLQSSKGHKGQRLRNCFSEGD